MVSTKIDSDSRFGDKTLINLDIVDHLEIPFKQYFQIFPDDSVLAFNLSQKLISICERMNGLSLSASQVGIPYNLFVYKYDTEFKTMIDCVYHPLSEEKSDSVEGCLSFKKNNFYRYFKVKRYSKIQIIGKILDISCESPSISDYDQIYTNNRFGSIFQHEIDHSSNITIQSGKEIKITKNDTI